MARSLQFGFSTAHGTEDLLLRPVGWKPYCQQIMNTLTIDYTSCIQACDDCAGACDFCAASCLGEEKVGMMAKCIAYDIDCAAICRAASGFMSRGSDFAVSLCRVCAEVCEQCAEECAKHDTRHCQQCAEACHRCAKECRNMA